jgi:RES domain-containing protein
MRYYRIMSETYYKNPFSCSAGGGRWNPHGSRMIYAGSAPTVALLEYLCIKGTAVGSKAWHMVVYEIADETWIGTLEKESLPNDWNILPHGKATQDFGKAWLEEMEFPFLIVPSSRVDIAFYPLEHNLLINPDFPSISELIQVVDTVSFDYLLNSYPGLSPIKSQG